jgi:hypothetical protein
MPEPMLLHQLIEHYPAGHLAHAEHAPRFGQ